MGESARSSRRQLRVREAANLLLTIAAIGVVIGFVVKPNAPPAPRALAGGQMAPEFEAETLDGAVVRLADFRGRPVVLQFFSTVCRYSQENVADLNRFAEAHPEVGVLAVDLGNESAATIRKFEQTFAPAYPLLLDLDGAISAVYRPYATPFWFLIGAEGRVRYVIVGSMTLSNLEAALREHLGGTS